MIARISLISGKAQDRKSLTMPFDGGTLTFQYYEKDGVKVPDGPMEFQKANYTEKGECKDGYREGRWVAKIENKTNSTVTEYNYSRGMLEGNTTIKFTTTDKSLLKYNQPYESYTFHNGRLIGENMIVHQSDTIYCNFGENGKRIGTWKFVDPEHTYIIEFDDDQNLQTAYELDILGQKNTIDVSNVERQIFMDLLMFDNKFREVFFSLNDKKRPKLPTLSDNEYGYENIWVK